MENIFKQLNITSTKITKFCMKENIDLMVAFGSQAKGTTNGNSDLDLAVRIKKTSKEPDLLDLTFKLSQFFNGHFEIDLIILKPTTGIVLRNEIFSVGRPLFEKSPNLFNTEAWKAWIALQDAKPLLHRHHRDDMNRFQKMAPNVS